MEKEGLLNNFLIWAKIYVSPNFKKSEFGLADQSIENVAWAKIVTVNTVSGIKIWDTGDFYLEILALDQEVPELAEFGSVQEPFDFSSSFSQFFKRIRDTDSRCLNPKNT